VKYDQIRRCNAFSRGAAWVAKFDSTLYLSLSVCVNRAWMAAFFSLLAKVPALDLHVPLCLCVWTEWFTCVGIRQARGEGKRGVTDLSLALRRQRCRENSQKVKENDRNFSLDSRLE
jgi:hypothetical protein